jgi:hypothetical protein
MYPNVAAHYKGVTQTIDQAGLHAWFLSDSIKIEREITTLTGLLFIQWWRLRLASLDVPSCTRAAIHFTDRVVSRRSRAAIASLPGAFLRWLSKSASAQPSRYNSSAMIRSARFSPFCRRNSPA